MSLVTTARQVVHRWAVSSQLTARRNAMLGATALASRRAERLDVDAYFAALDHSPHPEAPATGPAEQHVPHRSAGA